MWQGEKYESRLFIVFANGKAVRFKIKTLFKSNTPDGTFEIIRPDDIPNNILFVQFYPSNRSQFWLGQLRRIIK